jgi:hypothetical protein
MSNRNACTKQLEMVAARTHNHCRRDNNRAYVDGELDVRTRLATFSCREEQHTGQAEQRSMYLKQHTASQCITHYTM